MAEFPALPLFTDAYMADTRHLSTAQHGAYLLLLMTAWRMPDCKLPDDDKFLSRIAGMDLRTWNKNRDDIMSFWRKDDEGKFYQRRLMDERKHVEQLSRKNSKSARTRWLKNKDSENANAMPNRCQIDAPTPTPTPYPIHTNNNLFTTTEPHETGDLNDFEKLVGFGCWLVGKKSLPRSEQEILSQWLGYGLDLNSLAPEIEKTMLAFTNKNGGARPKSLAYYTKMLIRKHNEMYQKA